MPEPTRDVPPWFAGVQLAGFTTLRLGGPADAVDVADSDRAVVAAVRAAGAALLVLSGGSNVVVGDAGFAGRVVLLRNRGSVVTRQARDRVTLSVSAGEPWDDVVAMTVAEGFAGLECLSGIPGSAGATPIQNVGAYGQEVAETIVAVRVYDRYRDGVITMGPADCDFAYRMSIFKHNDRFVVISVDFSLIVSAVSAPIRYAELARALGVEPGERAPLAEVRTAVLALRASKGMVLDPADPDTYSVGSFFTNPVLDAAGFAALCGRVGRAGTPPAWPGLEDEVKVSAAWLIERAGFARGYGRDGIAISSKHTLALTNRGCGSTTTLLALAREIRDGVRDQFGVTLCPEPVLVNCVL